MYWPFGILLSLDKYLAQPGCSGEGLGLSTGQGALPSLRIGEGGGKGVWREWEESEKREEVEIWIGIFFK